MGLSIFLVVAGIGVMAGGAWCMNNLEVTAAIGSDFTNAVIAFGVLLIVIGSLGLAGAMNESRVILACVRLQATGAESGWKNAVASAHAAHLPSLFAFARSSWL